MCRPVKPHPVTHMCVSTLTILDVFHTQDNDWGITSYPLIPGHEVVGTIAAKGANVTGLEVGQR